MIERIFPGTRACLAGAGLALGIALVSLTPSSAAAQSPEQACRGDAFRLCGEHTDNRQRTAACLRANRRSLSPACRAYFTKSAKKSRKSSRRKARRRR